MLVAGPCLRVRRLVGGILAPTSPDRSFRRLVPSLPPRKPPCIGMGSAGIAGRVDIVDNAVLQSANTAALHLSSALLTVNSKLLDGFKPRDFVKLDALANIGRL